MRLNGRLEIMIYVGRRLNRKNLRGWKKVREAYLPVLHYLVGRHRVWATAEEIDELDRRRSLTYEEVLAANRAAQAVGGTRVGGRRGGKDFLFAKVQRELLSKGVKGER